MKLILCAKCSDVVALRADGTRSCWCGKSGGRYLDDQNAEIWGGAIPLGFSNPSLAAAVRQLQRDREEGRDRAFGINFSAFVIPDGARSIKRRED